MAVFASAKPSGHGGVLVAGPAGVVTGHGAVGAWGGGWGHGGHGAALIAPAATAVVSGGWGHGGGWGGHGGWGVGGGWGGWGGHGHGVAVVGPHAEPAVIAGPAGKIVADGVWGNTGHGHW